MLTEKKILLADGAWGTELAKKGFGAGGDCPELLNIENPDLVLEVAASYIEAGSDIILTNTSGGNPYQLAKYGLDNRLEELNEAGMRISQKAAGEHAFVLGSIGPTGEFLKPLGLRTEEDMTAAFARQVKSFVAGGADGILIETMLDLGESACALRAVRDNCDLPVVCTMTFEKGLKRYATIMGVKPGEAAEALKAAGADAVGSNCGSGILNIIEVTNIMRPATGLPLWVKPNAGLPELVNGKTVYRETPEEMASHIPTLIKSGADIIGGCCGTTPEHIRKFRQIIDKLRSEKDEG